MLRHRLAVPWRAGLRLARRFRPAAPGSFRILILHDVAPGQWNGFEALVDRLRRNGGLIAPEDAARRLAGRVADGAPASAPSALLSFDDGFASNLEAARRLAARGIRALFFVCPGLIDRPLDAQRAAIAETIFDGKRRAGDLPADARLLSWDEIAAIARLGHAIGAHGMNHRRLSRLAGAELEREIVGAGTQVFHRLGGPPAWFAYPFGDIDSISAPALASIGRHFRFCRSGVRGVNRPGLSRLAARADAVDLAAPAAWQDVAAMGGLDFRYAAARRRLDALAATVG